MEHVATKGPLAVAVAASDWFSYFGGVFDGCRFDRNIEINHGKDYSENCFLKQINFFLSEYG